MTVTDDQNDKDDKDDDSWRGRDQVRTASCGHMVQSNGTCGEGTCPNHGGS